MFFARSLRVQHGIPRVTEVEMTVAAILQNRQITQIPGGHNEGAPLSQTRAVVKRRYRLWVQWSGKASWRWCNLKWALKQREPMVGGGEKSKKPGLL